METENKQLLTSKKEDDGRELITEPDIPDKNGREILTD